MGGRMRQNVNVKTLNEKYRLAAQPPEPRYKGAPGQDSATVRTEGGRRDVAPVRLRIPRLIRTAAEETLRENEAIEAILIYGSRARGDHRRGSDYDIAIVSSLPRKEAFEAARRLYDEDLVKKHWTEIATTSSQDLDRYADTAGTLESRIAREAVLIAGEWIRPTCKQGSELDIDIEKALEWSHTAIGNGLTATMWLRIASSEGWPGDNEAATRVQRMDEQVAKGIVATFGIHERDIHDLDRTADELHDAYRDTRWRETERRRFASRIRGLESKGRAALRAEKWKRPFEPVRETIERLGKTWLLLVEWIEAAAKLHPESRRTVMDIAREVDEHLCGSDEDPKSRGIDGELMTYVRRTRRGARQLGSECDEESRSGSAPRP